MGRRATAGDGARRLPGRDKARLVRDGPRSLPGSRPRSRASPHVVRAARSAAAPFGGWGTRDRQGWAGDGEVTRAEQSKRQVAMPPRPAAHPARRPEAAGQCTVMVARAVLPSLVALKTALP